MHKQKIIDYIKLSFYRLEQLLKTDLIYLAKGGFWLFIGQTGSWVFGFVLSLILARILSKDVFGNYQFVLALLGTIGAFSLTGMNAAVTRAIAQGKDKIFKDSIHLQIKWNGLMMVVGFAIGTYYLYGNNLSIGWSMIIASIFIPFANAYNTYVAFLNGRKNFKKIAIYGINMSLAVSFSILFFSFFSKSIPLLIGIYSAMTFLTNFIAYKITVKQNIFNNESDNTSIEYGKHLSLINVLFSISQQLDKILLFHYLGGTVLASYFISTIIPENIKNFVKITNPLSLPKFSKRSLCEIQKNIYHKLVISIIFSFILAMIYSILSPIIFKLMFPGYLDAINLTKIYSLTIIFSGPTILLMSVFNSQTMVKQIFLFNTSFFIIRLVIIFIGIKIAGVYGLAWGMVIFNLIMLIVLIGLFYQTPVNKQIKKYITL